MPKEPLWHVQDAQDYLGVPRSTLYKWSHNGEGPPVIRVGRHLRYDPADVAAWVESQKKRQAS